MEIDPKNPFFRELLDPKYKFIENEISFLSDPKEIKTMKNIQKTYESTSASRQSFSPHPKTSRLLSPQSPTPSSPYYRPKDRFWKYNKDIIPRPLPYDPNQRIEKPELEKRTMSEQEFYTKIFPERAKKSKDTGKINLNQKSTLVFPKVKKHETVKLKINHGPVPGLKKYRMKKRAKLESRNNHENKNDLISILMKLYKSNKSYKNLPFSEPFIPKDPKPKSQIFTPKPQKILESLYNYGQDFSATSKINEIIKLKSKNPPTSPHPKKTSIPNNPSSNKRMTPIPLLKNHSTPVYTQLWKDEMIDTINRRKLKDGLDKKFMVYEKALGNIAKEDEETEEMVKAIFGEIKILKQQSLEHIKKKFDPVNKLLQDIP